MTELDCGRQSCIEAGFQREQPSGDRYLRSLDRECARVQAAYHGSYHGSKRSEKQIASDPVASALGISER
jgi:hypothetical protein